MTTNTTPVNQKSLRLERVVSKQKKQVRSGRRALKFHLSQKSLVPSFTIPNMMPTTFQPASRAFVFETPRKNFSLPSSLIFPSLEKMGDDGDDKEEEVATCIFDRNCSSFPFSSTRNEAPSTKRRAITPTMHHNDDILIDRACISLKSHFDDAVDVEGDD
jgi:hypothetical protein